MVLTAKTQVAVATEAIEGVAATPTAGSLIEVLRDPFPSPDARAATIKRLLATGSLTPVQGLAGLRDGQVSLRAELAGPVDGDPTTSVPWAPLAKACGYRQLFVKKHALAASWSSGSVLSHGTVFTADSTGAQGRVIGDYYEGDPFFVYEPIGSTAIGGGDSTVDASGVSATLSSPGTIADAQAFEPIDDPVSQIAIDSVTSGPINPGDELLGGTSGARARCANRVAVNDGDSPLEFVLYNTGAVDVSFVAGETISVVGGSASAAASAGVQQRQLHLPSVTIWTLLSGRIHRFAGARGNLILDINNADRGLFTFEMLGKNLGPLDQSNFTWPGPKAAIPPTAKGGLLRLDEDYQPLYGQVRYATNNRLTNRQSPSDSSSTGYKSVAIVEREHTTTFDKEAVRESVYPYLQAHYDKSTFRLRQIIGAIAGGSGNTFLIMQRNLQIDTHAHSDREGILGSDLTCMAVAGTDYVGNDETIIIAY